MQKDVSRSYSMTKLQKKQVFDDLEPIAKTYDILL